MIGPVVIFNGKSRNAQTDRSFGGGESRRVDEESARSISRLRSDVASDTPYSETQEKGNPAFYVRFMQ